MARSELRKLLHRASEVGVRAVLAASVDRADWDYLPHLLGENRVQIFISFGLHPYFVNEVTLDLCREHLEELQLRVESAGAGPESGLESGMVAIGECGLDFLRAKDSDARARQVEVFRAHLELARATGLPLTIHCVKAHGPLLELLRERATPPAAMHAFSGSAEVASQLVDAGHYISFAANVCIPNARRSVEAAQAIPRERLLIETDSPDQTPPARRPAANEPAFIVDVVARLAELRGVEASALAEQTAINACRLFDVELDALAELDTTAFDGRERGE